MEVCAFVRNLNAQNGKRKREHTWMKNIRSKMQYYLQISGRQIFISFLHLIIFKNISNLHKPLTLLHKEKKKNRDCISALLHFSRNKRELLT